MTRHILTAALTLTAVAATPALAQQTRSGLLLGIYAQSQSGGLAVRGFIPGYSAETVLRQNDVIMRATADGNTIMPTRTLYEIENVKSFFGADRDVALEVYRPGVGYEYCWVTFTSTGTTPAARMQSTATFKSEAVKPGARNLFKGGPAVPMPGGIRPPAGISPPPAITPPRPGVIPPPPSGRRDASQLFRRN